VKEEIEWTGLMIVTLTIFSAREVSSGGVHILAPGPETMVLVDRCQTMELDLVSRMEFTIR
jgi:hypothetical protein